MAGWLYGVLWLALLAAGCGLGRQELSGTVVRVLEGDLLNVEVAGKIRKVRVAGADCPERGQPGRDEARALTLRLAESRPVRVVTVGKDHLGHALGEVYLPDGRSLGRALVEAGLAWATGGRELEALQAEARSARRGLWRDPDPVAPWTFQRRKSWRD